MTNVRALTAFLLLAGASFVHAEELSWCVAVWYSSSEHPDGAEAITHNQEIDIVHPFWFSPLPDGSLQAHAGAEGMA